MADHCQPSDWVTVAVLGKPRGNKGELQAVSLSDSPRRFESLPSLRLFQDERDLGAFAVERAWWHGERLVLKFAGIDSIDAAAALAGAEARVEWADRAPLEEGAFYRTDLIGCDLVADRTGEPLGRVTGWEEGAGGALWMEIDGDWLLPFVPALCPEINVDARRIVAALPEGLKELNRP